MAAIITSLFFLFTMYFGHEKPCEYKRGKLKTFGAWLLMLFALADMALAVCIALKVQDTYNELDYTFDFFKKYALTSILMFGWAMYIFKGGPLRSKKWKRVAKSILYFLSSFMLLGSSSSDPMAGAVAMVITFILFFTILLIDTTGKKNRKIIKNQEVGSRRYIEEYDILQSKQPFEWKVVAKYVTKVLLTLVMTCFYLVNYFCMESYEQTYFLWIFYNYWCFLLFVYYTYLLWSKKTITGERILLLPLLQRIHLFQEYTNNMAMKKELIKIVLPILVASTICPFITTLIYLSSNNCKLEIYTLLLVIAPLLLIINLIKAYTQKWLYSQEQQKDE